MMAHGRALRWDSIDEAGMMLGMRLLLLIHRVLGRWPFRLALLCVVAYFYAVRRADREASVEYMRRVRGEAAWWARHRRSFRHFLAFGECLLDKALAWSGGLDFTAVRMLGAEHLAELAAKRRGALLLVAHLGNLEVARALARATSGIRLTVLVHARHSPRFTSLMARLSRESQVDLLQVADVNAATGVELDERIQQGQLVAIAADRTPVSADPRTTTVSFLGSPAPFPVGPYALAALLRCPVYLLVCLRLRGGYHLFVEPFADRIELPRDDRDAALRRCAAAFALRLEHYCALAPEQWFNFYAFWPGQGVSRRADQPAPNTSGSTHRRASEREGDSQRDH